MDVTLTLESLDSSLPVSQSQRKRPQGSLGQLEKKKISFQLKMTNEFQECFCPCPSLSSYFLVVRMREEAERGLGRRQNPMKNFLSNKMIKSTVVFWSLSCVQFFATHGLQHARFPYSSLSPWICSNSCPLSQWCHPTISPSVIPFSSCPQPFPEEKRNGTFEQEHLPGSCVRSKVMTVSSSWIQRLGIQPQPRPTRVQRKASALWPH